MWKKCKLTNKLTQLRNTAERRDSHYLIFDITQSQQQKKSHSDINSATDTIDNLCIYGPWYMFKEAAKTKD